MGSGASDGQGDGRFCVEGVVPGLAYELAYYLERVKGLSVEKPGQTKDVGDVKILR